MPDTKKKPETGEKKDQTVNAEKKPKSGNDDVNGLLEGIGQFIRERKIFDLLVAWGMGLITVKLLTSSMRDFLQNDPNAELLRREERRRMMAELELNAERFIDRCKLEFEDTFGAVYQHLKEQPLMSDRDFKKFTTAMEKKRGEFDQRSVESKKTRKWVSISLISIFMLIGLIAGTETDTLIAIVIGLFVTALLGLIGYVLYNRSSNNGTGNSETTTMQEA